jgi:hypothetical protein
LSREQRARYDDDEGSTHCGIDKGDLGIDHLLMLPIVRERSLNLIARESPAAESIPSRIRLASHTQAPTTHNQ